MAEEKLVKIKVISGTVYRGKKRYGPGEFLDVDTAEADRLVALKVAEKAITGGPSSGSDQSNPAGGGGKK
jgi:hypothetical protein